MHVGLAERSDAPRRATAAHAAAEAALLAGDGDLLAGRPFGSPTPRRSPLRPRLRDHAPARRSAPSRSRCRSPSSGCAMVGRAIAAEDPRRRARCSRGRLRRCSSGRLSDEMSGGRRALSSRRRRPARAAASPWRARGHARGAREPGAMEQPGGGGRAARGAADLRGDIRLVGLLACLAVPRTSVNRRAGAHGAVARARYRGAVGLAAVLVLFELGMIAARRSRWRARATLTERLRSAARAARASTRCIASGARNGGCAPWAPRRAASTRR